MVFGEYFPHPYPLPRGERKGEGENLNGASMRKILEKIRKEVLEILPAFLFFLVMFHILMVTRSLTLREFGIRPHASAVAVIGALIVSKAVFIVNKFPFLNLYPRCPLFWNVLLKTAVFSGVTFIFLFIEEWLHQADKLGSFAVAFKHLTAGAVSPVFWSGDLWVTLLLLFYCVAAELTRVIGIDRTKKIFFGREN